VLLLQAVLFAQGGMTSLPVNALAMGLLGSATAALAWRALRRLNRTAAFFVAGWASVNVAALAVAIVLGLQPLLAHAPDGTPRFFPFGLKTTLPAVMIPHLLVGIGEGVLTVMVCRLVMRMRAQGGQAP
jgi:cobalt/nickel transport system permease protein